MKKIITSTVLLCLLLCTYGFVKYNNISPYITIIPSNAKGTGSIINSTRFSTWIGGVTPTIDVFVKPADSPNFVGDNSPISLFDRQDFFRWSEQMFLWILSPSPSDGSYGNCSGYVFNSAEFFDYNTATNKFIRHRCSSNLDPVELKNNKSKDVVKNMSFEVKGASKGKKNLPLFFEEGTNEMFDVDNTPRSKKGYQLVKNLEGKEVEVSEIKINNNKLIFYDLNYERIINPSLILSKGLNDKSTIQKFYINNKEFNIQNSAFGPILILPNLNQAGGDKVLMARNGSLVYYNIMVNDIFVVFSTMVNNGTLPNDTPFPTTLEELNVIKSYATAHNIPIINTENRVLAMELKTSWIENINLPNNGSQYIKINATIPNYTQTSPGTWTKNGVRTAQLALVGMHVVGSALGHPEMIWSTFEHVNNTPNQSYSFLNNSNTITTKIADTNQTDWLFCETGATSFNISHISRFSNSIIGTNGFNISPSNTRRNQPFGWGGFIGQQGINSIDILSLSESNAQLVAINTDAKNRLLAGDIRRNYIQIGSTWGSLINPGTQAGTIKLSNSTMETYTQSLSTSINTVNDGLNCFSCHESGLVNFNSLETIEPVSPSPGTMFLSHVFYGDPLVQ